MQGGWCGATSPHAGDSVYWEDAWPLRPPPTPPPGSSRPGPSLPGGSPPPPCVAASMAVACGPEQTPPSPLAGGWRPRLSSHNGLLSCLGSLFDLVSFFLSCWLCFCSVFSFALPPPPLHGSSRLLANHACTHKCEPWLQCHDASWSAPNARVAMALARADT